MNELNNLQTLRGSSSAVSKPILRENTCSKAYSRHLCSSLVLPIFLTCRPGGATDRALTGFRCFQGSEDGRARAAASSARLGGRGRLGEN